MMDKEIDKVIEDMRDLEKGLGEVENKVRYIKVVEGLKDCLDKLDDMVRNKMKLEGK